jgi:hypothetical protein
VAPWENASQAVGPACRQQRLPLQSEYPSTVATPAHWVGSVPMQVPDCDAQVIGEQVPDWQLLPGSQSLSRLQAELQNRT